MATFVAKTVGKKYGKKYVKDSNFLQNPITDDSYQIYEKGRPTGMSKQGVWVNPGISEHDYLILKKVKHRAYILDNKFGPKSFQFGLSNIIGLIPGAGDGAEVCLSAILVATAMRISGDKNWLFTLMCWNIFIDFLIGLVPILGDVGDVLFRSNTRNAILLEKHLTQRAKLANEEKSMRRSGNRSRTPTPPNRDPEMAQKSLHRDAAEEGSYQNMVEAITRPERAKLTKSSAEDPRRHRG